MDYTNLFPYMQAEITLIAVIVLIFLFDLFAGARARRQFPALVAGLLLVQLLVHN